MELAGEMPKLMHRHREPETSGDGARDLLRKGALGLLPPPGDEQVGASGGTERGMEALQVVIQHPREGSRQLEIDPLLVLGLLRFQAEIDLAPWTGGPNQVLV